MKSPIEGNGYFIGSFAFETVSEQKMDGVVYRDTDGDDRHQERVGIHRIPKPANISTEHKEWNNVGQHRPKPACERPERNGHHYQYGEKREYQPPFLSIDEPGDPFPKERDQTGRLDLNRIAERFLTQGQGLLADAVGREKTTVVQMQSQSHDLVVVIHHTLQIITVGHFKHIEITGKILLCHTRRVFTGPCRIE